MKNLFFKRNTFMLLFTFFSYVIVGQTIKGKVTDANGNSVPYINVVEKGTSNGTLTDDNGMYSIDVNTIPTVLIFSSMGYTTISQKITSSANLNITISESDVSLDEIVLTGNRSKPRTILDSPVPIDNVSVQELKATGQTSVDKMLTYTIPSYNASSQTVSDATAHFDPADLRGLGPSRTLVLVNGKRKNQSALVYVNDTPGKGEVGTDMKSIPTAAIERVEVLRDGASAQYGSDAIAGVVNIILKKNINYTEVNASTGYTSKLDGLNASADINHTFTFADKGFANVTFGLDYQEKTNRAGTPGADGLFGVDNQWTRDNPDLGMTIGMPEMKKADFFLNAEYPISEDTKLYLFGGFNVREGTSFSLYRTPYWPGVPTDAASNPLYDGVGDYQGFQPTFETGINDNLLTAGIQFKFLGFNADASATYGSNTVDYTIGNTINPSLGANSPTNFDAGGYGFNNILGNFDINKSIDAVSFGFGVEARRETFEVTAGEEASYIDGGAQSFPGLQPGNALKESRTNVGVYSTLDWDISEKFLIGGAIRYENFSDFGGNTSWKVNSRYKINDAAVLRASFGTGFRAPSLHQVYLSNVQTLVSNGTISNQGTFNNVDPIIKDLGIKSLFAETSKNLSVGGTLKVSRNFSVSLDYYRVAVDDRVLFSGEINATDDNGAINADVQQILDDNSVTSIKFFINAVNTVTEGFDFVLRQKNIEAGAGKFGINLALNINKTTLEGIINTPDKLANYKEQIFSRKEQARITDSRPNTKVLFGVDYNIKKLNMALNNTYFGSVKWQHAVDPTKDQVFAGKVITDLSLRYAFTEKISANLIVNNLLNVYPDVIDTKGDVVTDLGGRFKYPWEVNQFGFTGTTFKAGISYKF